MWGGRIESQIQDVAYNLVKFINGVLLYLLVFFKV